MVKTLFLTLLTAAPLSVSCQPSNDTQTQLLQENKEVEGAKNETNEKNTFSVLFSCDIDLTKYGMRKYSLELLEMVAQDLVPGSKLVSTFKTDTMVSVNGGGVREFGVMSFPLAALVDYMKNAELTHVNEAISHVAGSFGLSCIGFQPTAGQLISTDVLLEAIE